ncbi:MAG: cell division protein FtsH [Anaerolineaceae bacterium 4572_78]|nr:MAG: cell division protein FtsH [Anaerolineaceae bacterium 4572_78]
MNWSRVFYLTLAFTIGALLLAQLFVENEETESISLTKLAENVQKGQVEEIKVQENDLEIILKGDLKFESRKEENIGIGKTLLNLGVPESNIKQIRITVLKPSRWSSWVAILGTVIPLVLIGLFFLFILRQAQGAGNQALGFGKSKARMFTGDKPTVTFDDVAGVVEAKEELKEVVEFLREPEKFISLGARIPKGVLMVGVPGCGKTLLAKAVSGEAGVPFFSISGSEFVEMFVGVGASRVRDLFDQAHRNSPCIIFVDEIDAVGRHRGAGLGGSHDEREQTLNQILVEMDGFDTDTNVIVIAATNRPDILDPALLRPGRFDRRVVLDMPDKKGREEILKVHVRGKPLSSDIDLKIIAKITVGFVGADLENLVNEASILAARNNQKQITQENFQDSIEKVLLGPTRHSKIINEKERKVIAYREAGQAIISKLTPESDPVHKISILPRGREIGTTIHLPDDDRTLVSKTFFKTQITVLMGGRAAEEIVFPCVTNSTRGDLERATRLARNMVTQYGMSKLLGPLMYGQKEQMVFLGKEIGEHRNYSEDVARVIDLEVRRIVVDAYNLAKQTLIENRDKLDSLAEKLMKHETVDAQMFNSLFA